MSFDISDIGDAFIDLVTHPFETPHRWAKKGYFGPGGKAIAEGKDAIKDAVTGKSARDRIEKANSDLQELSQLAAQQTQQGWNRLQPMFQPGSAQQAFQQAAAGRPVREVQPFQFNTVATAHEMLDPSIRLQTQLAREALESSGANAGGMLSSDFLKQMAGRAQQIGMTGWQNALNSAQAEGARQQGAWQQAGTFGQTADIQRMAGLGQSAGLEQQRNLAAAGSAQPLAQQQWDAQRQLAIQQTMNNLGKKTGLEYFMGNVLPAIGQTAGTVATVAGMLPQPGLGAVNAAAGVPAAVPAAGITMPASLPIA